MDAVVPRDIRANNHAESVEGDVNKLDVAHKAKDDVVELPNMAVGKEPLPTLAIFAPNVLPATNLGIPSEED